MYSNQLRIRTGWAALGLLAALVISDRSVASIQFNAVGSGPTAHLAASATFDIVSGNFQVTLANTSSSAIAVPADVLMGLLFSVAGITDLTPAAANAATASGLIIYTANGNVIQNPANPGPGYLDVSGEWAYVESASGSTGTFKVGGAGRDVWGSANVMNGPDRDGGSTPPDGADFGIVSASTTLSSGNNGYKNNGPYVINSILFDLGAVPGGFSLTADKITGVTFVYGTSANDPSIIGQPPPPGGGDAPEAASLAIWSLLMGSVAFVSSRRRSADAP